MLELGLGITLGGLPLMQKQAQDWTCNIACALLQLLETNPESACQKGDRTRDSGNVANTKGALCRGFCLSCMMSCHHCRKQVER